MAGARQPGPWGLQATAGTLDDGTSCRMPSPLPGPIGLDSWKTHTAQDNSRGAVSRLSDTAVETIEDLQKAVSDFERSETWFSLRPVVFGLLGQYSFGLGVVYGIGENIVTSVVELLQLVKTFLLADLYDRVQQPVFSAASFNPVALFQRLLADVSMRAFHAQLEHAHQERAALIEELRYAMTHIGEVLGGIKEGYVGKWNRFEAFITDRTLSSQFQAGRLFGEVLLEVVSVIGGGTAAVRAAGKIPRLAKLARLKIPAKSSSGALRAAEGAAAREAPVTPSQARPSAPVVETVSKNAKGTSSKDVWVLDEKGVPIGARKGIAKEGLPAKTLSRDGWPDLPYNEAPNFNSAQPVTLKPGTKIYRIIDDTTNPAGGYWTEQLPSSRAEWRSDYAVKTNWNSNGQYVEYVVPEGAGLTVWRGEAAAQRLGKTDFYLPGGGEQLWLGKDRIVPIARKPTGW